MIYLKLIRLNQWVKNLLIFAPLIFAHDYDISIIKKLIFIFISFSFICSSTYIFNDLIDLKNDKNHPTKKFRPIPSGDISIKTSKIIGVFFLVFGFLMLFHFNNLSLLLVYAIYLILNILYTFYFKKKFLIDVGFLVSFYFIRIYIGSLVSEILISNWLILFALFFFTSLAFVKRANEIYKYSNIGNFSRNYEYKNFKLLKFFFYYSGLLTAIVFIFYINSTTAEEIYENTFLLYPIPIILVLFFNILNKQLLNKEIRDDPTMHILLDKKIFTLFLLISFFYFIA